jgi:uncharacterized protein
VIKPSEWLPALWGEFEPQWGSSAESEATVSLLLRHMNGIANTLMESPEKFEPIVLEHDREGETVTSVEEWSLGYMRGVELASTEWRSGGEELFEILFPIMAFATEKGRTTLNKLEAEEVEALKRSIPDSVRRLHAYWLEQRLVTPGHQPVVQDEPRVGRNDPCPCGSGKKFKKCCLH